MPPADPKSCAYLCNSGGHGIVSKLSANADQLKHLTPSRKQCLARDGDQLDWRNPAIIYHSPRGQLVKFFTESDRAHRPTYTRKETTKKRMRFFWWKTDGCTYSGFLLVVFCRLNLWNCVHVLHGPHFYPFKIDSRGKRCPVQSDSSLKAGDTEIQLYGSPPSFPPPKKNASVLYFHPDKAQLVHTRTCTSKPVDPDTAFIFLCLVLCVFLPSLEAADEGGAFYFVILSSFILQEQEHSSVWLPICETVSGERLQDG